MPGIANKSETQSDATGTDNDAGQKPYTDWLRVLYYLFYLLLYA